MKRAGLCVAAIALLWPGLSSAAAPGARDPDWPCQQIRVPELSLAAIWAGPAIDPQHIDWKSDQEIADLVQQLVPRRVPLETAQQMIHKFAQRAGDRKQPRLLVLLAGLFQTLNRERDSVLAGLDRFGHRQKELAVEIRADNEKLHADQTNTAADPHAVNQLTEQIKWEVQVFEDRRQALSYACEVPGKVEQRLFAFARTIQQALD